MLISNLTGAELRGMTSARQPVIPAADAAPHRGQEQRGVAGRAGALVVVHKLKQRRLIVNHDAQVHQTLPVGRLLLHHVQKIQVTRLGDGVMKLTKKPTNLDWSLIISQLNYKNTQISLWNKYMKDGIWKSTVFAEINAPGA